MKDQGFPEGRAERRFSAARPPLGWLEVEVCPDVSDIGEPRLRGWAVEAHNSRWGSGFHGIERN